MCVYVYIYIYVHTHIHAHENVCVFQKYIYIYVQGLYRISSVGLRSFDVRSLTMAHVSVLGKVGFPVRPLLTHSLDCGGALNMRRS